jgi:PAP2 superfamily
LSRGSPSSGTLGAVQTVALSWQHAGEVSAVVAAVGGALALPRSRTVRHIGAFLREAAVIGVLYALWQLAGTLSVMGVQDAYHRAHWIQGVEGDVGLPSERSVQGLVLGHPLLVQASNLYYATMHFPMMFVFLIWLFWRHRDRYRPVRQVLGWTTLGCLLIQLVPVAPPRMLPGIVDTALRYGQSVYSNGLAVDQLSAMPSVHVGWAVFVGFYSWRVSTSGWRYLGFAHTAVTVFVVVATGNHWWLDGIVATAVLVAAAWLVGGTRAAWAALRRTVASGRTETPPAPAPEPALID